MFITSFDNEEPAPARGGGNADVFRGAYCGRQVAIKVVRLDLRNLDERVKVGSHIFTSWDSTIIPSVSEVL